MGTDSVNTKATPFLNRIDTSDPEIAEIVQERKRDYATGKIRDAPRRYVDTRDWRDAWLYIFKLVSLWPDDFMWLRKQKVVCVVWCGHEFNDALLGPLEKIAAKLGTDQDLEELRLIDAGLSKIGIARVQKIIPRAKVTQYSEQERDENPRLAYADPAQDKRMFP